MRSAIIGFGEAARTFVGSGLPIEAAYDIDPKKRDGIAAFDRPEDAVAGAHFVLSLVTADQALAAAERYAPLLSPTAYYFDMNSVSPETKRAASMAVSKAGAKYLDVAIMAPVHPGGVSVPLLVSGPDAAAGLTLLEGLGFTNVRGVGDAIGRASSIKMIRSVMIKGIEALTAEMTLAARQALVEDDVLLSLGEDWPQKAAYNLERMSTHGLRRAAEMEEVAKTLVALGIDPVMTRGTIIRQREMAA